MQIRLTFAGQEAEISGDDETDLLGSAELAELDPDGSRPLEGMHGHCGRRFDCFDPVCSTAVGVGAEILPSAGIEFLPREDALISQGHPSP